MATNNVFKSSTIYGVLRNSDNTVASPAIQANAIFDRDVDIAGKITTDRINSRTGRIDLSGNIIDISGNSIYLGHTGSSLYIKDVLYTGAGGDVTQAGNNTFTGLNTFTQDISVNSLTVGRGGGNISTNTTLGVEAFKNNTIGVECVSVGAYANNANTEGNYNIAVGFNALKINQLGTANLAIGRNTLQAFAPLTAVQTVNIAIGQGCLFALTTGKDNTAIGSQALRLGTTMEYSTGVGSSAGLNGNFSYCTSIGYNSQPTANNQVVLGTAAETVIVPGAMDVSGIATFNTNLPTSTVTPTTSTQLITKTYADTALDLKANLASPTFTGVPIAPTASLGTNTTQLATTAFVLANSSSSSTVNEPLLLREAQSLNLDYDTYNVWTTTAGAGASTTSSVNYTTAMSANGKISYFAGSGDGVYRSINYFESSTIVNSATTTYRGVCCSSDGKFVFTPTANITPGSSIAWYYSSNYGTNWTAVTCTTAGSQTGQVGFDKPVMSGDGKYILMTVSSPGNLNNIFLSSNYGATFAILPFTQTQQVSVYPIVMSLTGQYMTIFQFHSSNAVCYYSTNYGVTWTAGASVPKMTTACMSAYGETITALGTSSNNYYISTNYGASFTTLTNSGLNSAGQQMACNDSGQFQLVIQTGTNTVWASYDYGTTFASQVITLNNTPGTAFVIAGTWWNLSMSADGRYAITAGGNSGTPIALKLQAKDSIAKNVLAKGIKIYQENSSSPVLQYLGADGTNYAYLYASAFDNNFVFNSFRSGGFAFKDTTGTNSCTISNTGLLTADGGIKAPFISPNIRPYTTSPSKAETIDRGIANTQITAIPVGRIYFTTIYLPAGMVINGMSAIHAGASNAASRLCFFEISGTLLRSVQVGMTGSVNRIVGTFSPSYTIPASGFFFVGYLFLGPSTGTIIANATGGNVQPINSAAGTSLSTMNSGFFAMGTTATNLPTTGITAQGSIPWFSVV